jgi:hypothetical protein
MCGHFDSLGFNLFYQYHFIPSRGGRVPGRAKNAGRTDFIFNLQQHCLLIVTDLFEPEGCCKQDVGNVAQQKPAAANKRTCTACPPVATLHNLVCTLRVCLILQHPTTLYPLKYPSFYILVAGWHPSPKFSKIL